MLKINDTNLIDIENSSVLTNTPMVLIKNGDRDIAIPIMSYGEKITTEVVKEPTYYICTSVEDTTWTGKKLINTDNNKYTVSDEVVTGIRSTIYAPEIGHIYSNNTDIKIDIPIGQIPNKLYSTGYNSSYQLGTYPSTNNINVLTKTYSDDIDIVYANSYLHTMAIDARGRMWGVGSNGKGQLGLGHTATTPIFTEIKGRLWKSVIAGANYTIAVDIYDRVWTCGTNGNYALGIGSDDTAAYVTTFQDTGVSKALSVGMWNSHAMVLDNGGDLYACGLDEYGELCTGSVNTLLTTFTKVPKISVGGVNPVWSNVYCGKNFTVLMDTDGKLYSCGLNSSGQLGIGSVTNQSNVVEVGGTDKIRDLRFIKVAVGEAHVLAIDTNNDLWVWGEGGNGRKGDGSTTDVKSPTKITTFKCKDISAGRYHSVAIDMDGNIWTAGQGAQGQLGNGGTSAVNTFTKIDGGGWDKLGGSRGQSTFAFKE